ncbi:MAG: PQQ-binding-like beta-propeller repeat protein [Phycisphaerales bacterium]|nr:PQQ-binding-like beta-propeller repeat protein [Phycisphaerales bacterium]
MSFAHRSLCRITAIVLGLSSTVASLAGNWPQFHGPGGGGVAEGKAPPASFDIKIGANVLWKTKLPGLAHSSPIIWGDRIYLVTAVDPKDDEPQLVVGLYGNIEPVQDEGPQRWELLCVDRANGKLLWRKPALTAQPRVKRHTKATHANSTPATNGERIVAFLGSEGIWCFDMDGEVKWKKDLGPLDSGYYVVPDAQWGFASSPIIVDDKVIIQCDVQKDSFIAALKLSDGSEVWRKSRDEVPTWGTPTVYTSPEGKRRIVVNGYRHIGAYDLDTGEEVWRLVGGGDIPVPTPIVAHDLIYITNGHGAMNPTYAIRTSAVGDITPPDNETPKTEHIAWWNPYKGNYMQTPMVVDDLLYMCRDNGVINAMRAKTGEVVWGARIGGGMTGFTSSGVAAGGRLFYMSEYGECYTFAAGESEKQLGASEINENCMATPAIADGVLYIRGERHLFAIGEKSRQVKPRSE